MKTDIKEINDFTRELAVTVPWEDLKEHFQAEFNRFRAGYSQAGFRKGKVPPQIIKKAYGTAIEYDFSEKALNEYYQRALGELDMEPINRANISDLNFSEGNDLNFTAVFEVTPPVKLPDYSKKIKVSVVKLTPTRNDVDNALKEQQRRLSEFKTVDGVCSNGHLIKGTFQELDDAENPIEDKKETRYFILGEEPFKGDVLKAIEGKKAGETVRIQPVLNDEKSSFDLTLEEIEEQVLPELNDEFVKKVDPEAKDLDELKTKIMESMQAQLEKEFQTSVQNKIIDYFVHKSEVVVPDSWKENYLKHTVEDAKKQLQPGQEFDEAKIREAYSTSADHNLKWHMIRSELLNAENLEVSTDDVKAKIEKLAAENEANAKQIRSFYKKSEKRDDLKEDISNEILFERLIGFTIIKEIAQTTDEFRKGAKGDE